MTCDLCISGAEFSKEKPSYHVTEFFEGRERDHILCKSVGQNIMKRALERISDSPVPDQPASYGDMGDTVWIMRHVAELRRIAMQALKDTAS
jgi:hypothetical protein